MLITFYQIQKEDLIMMKLENPHRTCQVGIGSVQMEILRKNNLVQQVSLILSLVELELEREQAVVVVLEKVVLNLSVSMRLR